MYTLEKTRKPRLLAPDGLTQADFDRLAIDLGLIARRARKIGFVAARKAAAREVIVTQWNGAETSNTAEPGDFIVANLAADRSIMRDKAGNPNIYVIAAAKFPALYEPDRGETEFGPIYRARGVVRALRLTGGFDIIAPWGQRQQAPDGYILNNGDEVYGNNRETFEKTYRLESGHA